MPRDEAAAGYEIKNLICSSCDIQCTVHAKVQDGEVVKIQSSDNPIFRDNICMKGIYAPKGFAHPNRITRPLKRVGERGSGEFEPISWDQAIDEIAEILRNLVDQYGPETLAVSTSDWNTSTDNGATRRFMNLLGSPNYISGVALCAGNTAAVNRLVYGWFPQPDYANTDCIVLFGHNPKRHSWTPVFNSIMRAKTRGAKLIVLDPRMSEMAERADIWLPLKAGTDAALCLGWLNVILNEGLYDQDFVDQWTIGFEELKARAEDFPPDRVAAITGVEPEAIIASARLYAEGRSVIPWTPITDQQRNSTSAIRLHAILRAICGNLDVPGGEMLMGLHPDIPQKSLYELHEILPDAQKAKQLGADKHPVFTYRGDGCSWATRPRSVWGHRHWANNDRRLPIWRTPSAVFKAMADGDPYPVKAFLVQGNNPLMSYANMKLIHRGDDEPGSDRCERAVHDPVCAAGRLCAARRLPGLERNSLLDGYLWLVATAVKSSQKAMEPPGECQAARSNLWRDIAHGMGLWQPFPLDQQTRTCSTSGSPG